MTKAVIIVVVILIIIVGIVLFYKNKQEDTIMYNSNYIINDFYLHESSGNSMEAGGGSQTFTFSLKGDSIIIETPRTGESKKKTLTETDRNSLESELISIIDSHELKNWDGYDEVLEVMDASHSFRFTVLYNDNSEINAKGFFMFPDNYNEVFTAVKTAFDKYHSFY